MSTILEVHNVKILGQGEQLVVLSHGFGADQQVWESILPFLEPHYKVLLYNLRGHGEEEAIEDADLSQYETVKGFADDLLDILSELQIEDCVYVGHSVSGMIGCLASIARPQVFRKLILLGASPRYLNDIGYEGGFDQNQIDNILAAIETDCSSWVKAFAPPALGQDAKPEHIRKYTRSFLSLKPEFTRVVAEAIFMSDYRAVLPLVTVPCCVIQTKEDLAVPISVGKYLKEKLAGEIELLECRGHLPHLTHPELLGPVLKRTLTG